MFCQKCGKEIPESSSFCTACGASIEAPAAQAAADPNAVEPKNRLVYALLAWFLGMFGVHNFYAGRIGRGVAQLILTLTCIGALVTAIWVIVDLFTVTADKNGVEMSSQKGGKIVAIIAIIVMLLNFFVMLLLPAGMLLPAIGTARGSARNIACVNNLKQIGLAITMYADDHDGQLPAAQGENGMEEMEDELDDIISENCFKCPENGEGCYVYIRPKSGKLSDITNPGATPIVYCLTHHSRSSMRLINVLFADGHVESIPMAEAAKYGLTF
ncbi:MAG: NINE protein [Victivallaceae bacterium]|nr:NINE protein [Victivallaceae bacterium]